MDQIRQFGTIDFTPFPPRELSRQWDQRRSQFTLMGQRGKFAKFPAHPFGQWHC